MAKHKGEILNRHYGRQAKQARYRENGIWYHNLERFPADLYDANGVLRFETAADYRKQMKIGPDPNHAHAVNGIAEISGYTPLHPAPHVVLEK